MYIEYRILNILSDIIMCKKRLNISKPHPLLALTSNMPGTPLVIGILGVIWRNGLQDTFKCHFCFVLENMHATSVAEMLKGGGGGGGGMHY